MLQTDQMVSFSSTTQSLRGEMELTLAEFDELLHKFCARITRPAPETAWSVFLAKPLATQQATIALIQGQSKFIQAALNRGIDGQDNLAVLRFALERLELDISDDLFDRVKSSDLCEIYNEEHFQVYRSFNFFDASNYSLLQLVTYPWQELWERPGSIERKISQAADAILRGNSQFESLSEEEPYVIRELQSAEPQTAILGERFMARLTNKATGRPYLFALHTCDITHVEGENLAFI